MLRNGLIIIGLKIGVFIIAMFYCFDKKNKQDGLFQAIKYNWPQNVFSQPKS